MSPNINSFVGDLVQMAQAMERLPQVEAELEAAKGDLNKAHDHSQGLELNIITYKQSIEELNAHVRSLEVERDEAMFRNLELEERNNRVVQALRTINARVDDTLLEVDPPKPIEPEQSVNSANDQLYGNSSSLAVAEVALTAPQPVGEHGSPDHNPSPSSAGESDWSKPVETSVTNEEWGKPTEPVSVDPTVSMSEDDWNAKVTNEPITTQAKAQPYAGKLYHDHPTYVRIQDWLEGGGTEENYYARPTRSSPML